MGTAWSTKKTEDYAAERLGASSASAGPEQTEYLTGAYHPSADEDDGASRNAFSQVQGLGLAASLPPEVAGVLSSDKPPEPALDGYAHSEISTHPDGRFALNTAATSELSLAANFEWWIRRLVGGPTERSGAGSLQLTEDTRRKVSELVFSEQRAESLPAERTMRLSEEPELTLVRPATEAPMRSGGNLLTGEWSVPQLAGVGLGVLALNSVVQRAF